MATTTNAKATLHQRAIHELKEFVILAVYLYITIGAVVLMKTAVLHTEGIEFAPWGIAVVKAAVLAKFMLLSLNESSKRCRVLCCVAGNPGTLRSR